MQWIEYKFTSRIIKDALFKVKSIILWYFNSQRVGPEAPFMLVLITDV